MATKQIAWNTGSGNITLTYQGRGADPISVVSDPNDTGNARSKTITIETTKGGLITKNVTVNQAACPFPVGHVKNFDYTGNVQSVLLPAGQYKLQCWGAQGGSNGTEPSYNIDAQAGGKGGYSEGVLTLSSPTTVYIFVGGQGGSSGNGGWNGGGGGAGSSQYDDGTTFGISKMGCGGGATDIALVTSSMSYSNYITNRSSASLLSRMIVSGGGSGGCDRFKMVTNAPDITYYKSDLSGSGWCIGTDSSSSIYYNNWFQGSATWYVAAVIDVSSYRDGSCYISKGTGAILYAFVTTYPSTNLQSVSYALGYSAVVITSSDVSVTVPSDASYLYVYMQDNPNSPNYYAPNYISLSNSSIDSSAQVGYVGGGVSGGYNSTYDYGGKQNAAGRNGGFGYGGSQRLTNCRWHGGFGGGGWYGGGTDYSNYYLIACYYHGGGSGFVNTAASAGNRPSGYTGLELDSGETKDGATSFPAPSGGNETGHSGNGYARIIRLA